MTEADKKILECLKERKSFLIDAGAGSGKTTSLIRALDYIRGNERKKLVQDGQRVACITFTNVAKNEIIERTDHDALFEVSTIHDFLWGAIKTFQKELKPALLTFNAELPATSRRKQNPAELEEALKTVASVSYSDRGANFLEGRIYHDDLLGVAKVMFRSHPMLSRLVAARYPFIFVDEYQDTHPDVIVILLDYILAALPRPMIAFFGDKVQSIYPDGVGELSTEQQRQLVTIQKEENYRCSKAVIEVLNKVRTDIKQVAAGDNLDGFAVYVNLAGIDPATDITDAALAKAQNSFGWKIEGEMKALFLTHRLIARKAGYEGLWSAYNARGGFAKDRFQSGEDPIAQFLTSAVDRLIDCWRAGKVGAAISLLNKPGSNLASAEAKARAKSSLDRLSELAAGNATIKDILKHVREAELLVLLDDLEIALSGHTVPAEPDSSEARHQVFMTSLLALPYQEVSNYRAVMESHLPYSTKHGVKGDEFQNVLVILDDAGANWNQYSFGNLLAGGDTSDARLTRTRNLFYVCCSRAKDKLIVAHVGNGDRTKMEAMFGVGAVAI